MSRKLFVGGLVVTGWLLLGWSVGTHNTLAQDAAKVAAQDAAKDAAKEGERTSVWMKQKLANSERILEGLTRGDLDLVSKHATAMKALNKIERFVRREPASYRTQLQVFQFSIDELVRTAQGGNIDGATLAFTQMTVSCVNCHKQLRKL